MKNITVFDRHLKRINLKDCHLSLQAGYSGVTFSVLHIPENKYLGLKHIHWGDKLTKDEFYDRFTKLLKKENLLHRGYASASFVFLSSKSSLIPEGLFDVQQLRNYFVLSEELDEFDELHYNKLSMAGAYTIFSVPSYLSTLLVNKFPNISFKHQSVPLIENALFANKQSGIKGPQVHLCTYPFFFDACVCDSDRLLLHNSYNYSTLNDFTYFAMNLFQQLKLDPEQCPIVLQGDTKVNSPRHKALAMFVRQVSFLKANPNYTYSYALQDLPPHSFANHLNLYQCA